MLQGRICCVRERKDDEGSRIEGDERIDTVGEDGLRF